ncbi:hypothetical protein G4Y79_02440 [Phototrophicus methaneseepsis]|uniref:Uncharacterized protein n=1 Tax=Phototrophicus methaneseepsis TaxID=2710758 RepID=A0A7S8EAA8_9CHLR|nr:hypothetical protein [Phototrophicus methaneseepsis]QPC83255.1 hypothetical protein G4Y79_02440 [Phototrophicus methaneseepsis]
MASEEKLQQEIERLYESTAVRDDLNDSEAQVLLQWGADYLRQSAADTSDEAFEERSKYMRQLMKDINRFVGQREFMDSMREFEQLGKVMKWLPHTGLGEVNQAQAAVNLPEDKGDMRANLDAILEMITPGKTPATSQAAAQSAAPVQEAPSDEVPSDNAPKLSWHNEATQQKAPKAPQKLQQEKVDTAQSIDAQQAAPTQSEDAPEEAASAMAQLSELDPQQPEAEAPLLEGPPQEKIETNSESQSEDNQQEDSGQEEAEPTDRRNFFERLFGKQVSADTTYPSEQSSDDEPPQHPFSEES